MATHSSIVAWRTPMDRGAWEATDRRVTKSQTWMKWLSAQARLYVSSNDLSTYPSIHPHISLLYVIYVSMCHPSRYLHSVYLSIVSICTYLSIHVPINHLSIRLSTYLFISSIIALRGSTPRQVDKNSGGPQGERGLEFSRRRKGQTCFFLLHSLALYHNNVSCLRRVSGKKPSG